MYLKTELRVTKSFISNQVCVPQFLILTWWFFILIECKLSSKLLEESHAVSYGDDASLVCLIISEVALEHKFVPLKLLN